MTALYAATISSKYIWTSTEPYATTHSHPSPRTQSWEQERLRLAEVLKSREARTSYQASTSARPKRAGIDDKGFYKWEHELANAYKSKEVSYTNTPVS